MSESELLLKLKNEIENHFKSDLLPFWTEFAIDDINGGFVGQITYDNTKVYNAPKGGILNARFIWSFSAGFKKFGTKNLENAAKIAYNYFVSNFVDKVNGGFYWIIDENGNVIDDRKHIYAQAFGIYGLIEYYSAFKDESTLKLAFQVFDLIERNSKDFENGGYFESYNGRWELNEDARLSDKDENEPKSMNTHLHILEAYTNLYRHTKNEQVKNILEQLIQIFCDKIVTSNKRSLVNFMDVDWSPKSNVISFGHDVEASWLLYEAAEIIDNQSLIEKVKEITISLCDAVLEGGIDTDGGLLNEADKNQIIDSDKDWWPQAEAVVGFLNAYQITDDVTYLKVAANSWEFIKSSLIDTEFGEWFEKVNKNGIPYSKMDKVRSWKGPYHNMRMVFEVISRVEQITEHLLVAEDSKSIQLKNQAHD